MSDLFGAHRVGLESPADRHFPITAADADLAIIPRSIRVDGAGTLVLRDGAGTDVTYNVVAGEVLVFRAVQVRAASTATGIVGWY